MDWKEKEVAKASQTRSRQVLSAHSVVKDVVEGYGEKGGWMKDGCGHLSPNTRESFRSGWKHLREAVNTTARQAF